MYNLSGINHFKLKANANKCTAKIGDVNINNLYSFLTKNRKFM